METGHVPMLHDTELRVLGVLIEKSLTQPGGYPMTMNAIVSGANQKQNREPVLELSEGEMRHREGRHRRRVHGAGRLVQTHVQRRPRQVEAPPAARMSGGLDEQVRRTEQRRAVALRLQRRAQEVGLGLLLRLL